MFTGLVQEVGTLRGIERHSANTRLRISCGFDELVLGESIAVNGACLTVKTIESGGFTADASSETIGRTTFASIRVGERVHLERALAVGERLGGHLVTGHVDGIGRLVDRTAEGDSVRMTVEAPAALMPFLAPKGSITIDGVSLTVNHVTSGRFNVMLVPFTLSETTFGSLPSGSRVNLEVDVLAKYVASLLGRPGVDGEAGPSLDQLREQGYL